MDRGMLIDVEHLSSRAFDSTLAIARRRSYPLISSHTGLRALAVPRPPEALHVKGCSNEAMRNDQQLRALKDLGSVLGVGGHVGLIQDLSYDVSTGWAQAYRHAQDTLGFDAVAIGTDMNGLAAAPGPRFASDPAAPGGLRPLNPDDAVRPIRYGKDQIPIIKRALEQTAMGKRKYDFNTDGLAHYGLLPDFTLDVALSVGGKDALAAFFNSAEAVVKAWTTCAPS